MHKSFSILSNLFHPQRLNNRFLNISAFNKKFENPKSILYTDETWQIHLNISNEEMLTSNGLMKCLRVLGVPIGARVGLAISGGVDSMALAVLASNKFPNVNFPNQNQNQSQESNQYPNLSKRTEPPPYPVIAFVVDHRLRTHSESEAQQVISWLHDLEVEAELLTCDWSNGKPKAGNLQEAARLARYSLIEDACVRHGVRFFLTAHHADDQAESFLIRFSRCSGLAGLSAMATSSTSHRTPGIQIIRPFLKIRKEKLMQICQLAGQTWVEDPTNVQLDYARNRVRAILQHPSSGIDHDDVICVMESCQVARRELDSQAFHLLMHATNFKSDGSTELNLSLWLHCFPEPSILHALAIILKYVGLKDQPPRSRGMNALLSCLNNCQKGNLKSYTIAGCVVSPLSFSKGKYVKVKRLVQL